MRPIDKPQGRLGVLWMIYGAICLAEALWIAVNDSALTTMWGTVVSRVGDPFAWMNSFRILLVGMIALAVGAGILALLAGMALMRRTSLSRALVLTASTSARLKEVRRIKIGRAHV